MKEDKIKPKTWAILSIYDGYIGSDNKATLQFVGTPIGEGEPYTREITIQDGVLHA